MQRVYLPLLLVLLACDGANTVFGDCLSANRLLDEIASGIVTTNTKALTSIGITTADLLLLQNPANKIKPYQPGDADFEFQVRAELDSVRNPEYPEAVMTLLEAPQNSKADPDAGGELDDAIRRDIIADLHRLSRFRGWSVIDTALGTLDEEQPVENLAPAVDIYRDSLIVIQARNGQQRRLYVPELWRVGSCWKIVGLRLEDVPGRPPQRRTQKVSDVSTHVSAEKFWEAYTLGDIEASLARRWQMFWRRSSEPTSFFRTSLAELRDRKARLTGLKAAVDEVLRRWSREPDRVWDPYDRGSPSWLFTAISGFEPKSYAEASAWWSVNRDRVILDGTGNALTVTSP